MPNPPPITNLNSDEHIEFIKTYQTRFDTFYSSSAARKHGAQKLWVVKNVIGDFQQKFGQCSAALLVKIDRYLRNHSSCHQRASGQVVIPPTAPRAISWTQVMSEDKKEDIKARISNMRDTEGVGSSGDYLRYFHRARQEVIDSLQEDEIKEYKELAGVETDLRKAPPTPAAVFKMQSTLATLIASAIRGRLGWEAAGNVGDAVCFFGIAYRNEDQEIKSQFSVVSNCYLPQDEVSIPRMIKDFREYVNPALQELADKFIPRLEVDEQLPQLELNPDEISPKILRNELLQYIVASWVASGMYTTRTAENLPWEELSTPAGREFYLVNHAQFASSEFFNPTFVDSHDTLCIFAEQLMSIQSSPLFKHSATSNASSLSSLGPLKHDLPNLGVPEASPDDTTHRGKQSASPEPKKPLQLTLPKNPTTNELPPSSTPPPTSPVVDQSLSLVPTPLLLSPIVDQLASFTLAPSPTNPGNTQLPLFTSDPPVASPAADLTPMSTVPSTVETPALQNSNDAMGTMDIETASSIIGENSLVAAVGSAGHPESMVNNGDITSEITLGKRRRNTKALKPTPVYSPKKLRTSTRLQAGQQMVTTTKVKQPAQRKNSRK